MMEYLAKSINKYLHVSSVANFVNNHRILTSCATVGLIYGAWFFKRPKNLPPGPWGYPIVGSLPSLTKSQNLGVTELAKRYGDVSCVWIGGNNYWIFLHGYETIKEAYITHGADFMDRDIDRMMQYFGIEDTIISSHYDDTYKASRKIASQGFRTLISTKLQSMLEDNLDEVDAALKSNLGQPVDLSLHMKNTMTNCILELLFGTRYKHEDKEFNELREDIECWSGHLFECVSLFMIPSIWTIYFPNSILETTKRELMELKDLVERYVDEHKESKNDGEVRDLLDVYLQSRGPITFSKLQIASTMMSFLPDTVVLLYNMMMWMFVYLVNHTECQEQIYDEVQKVCGTEGVSLTKRPEMPVTESFIMEVFRHVNPVDFGGMAKPVKNTTFRGYNIPESAGILVHYAGVHRDPRFFPEPEIFKPKRFLKDGRIGNTEGFLPFGIGRRMCMGEQFVRNVIFYTIARHVSQYELHSPDGNKLSTESVANALFPKPKPFLVVLKSRE